MPADEARPLFAHVHMKGGRFKGGALPLSATTELERYQVLLRKVAKSLYRRDHPDRQRVSDEQLGLKDFELAITRLRSGSVSVDLGAWRGTPALAEDDSYAVRARRLIEEAFSDLGDTQIVSESFPAELIPELATMGKSLKEGESLTWAKSKRAVKQSPAILTAFTTEPIRNLQVDSDPVEDSINAYIIGVCSDPLQFTYKIDGTERSRQGKFKTAELFDQLREVCGFAKRTPLVALAVQREKAASQQVIDVLGIERLLPPSWSQRLEELASLEDGWLDGKGLAPTRKAIEAAESLLFCVLASIFHRSGEWRFTVGSPAG